MQKELAVQLRPRLGVALLHVLVLSSAQWVPCCMPHLRFVISVPYAGKIFVPVAIHYGDHVFHLRGCPLGYMHPLPQEMCMVWCLRCPVCVAVNVSERPAGCVVGTGLAPGSDQCVFLLFPVAFKMCARLGRLLRAFCGNSNVQFQGPWFLAICWCQSCECLENTGRLDAVQHIQP